MSEETDGSWPPYAATPGQALVTAESRALAKIDDDMIAKNRQIIAKAQKSEGRGWKLVGAGDDIKDLDIIFLPGGLVLGLFTALAFLPSPLGVLAIPVIPFVSAFGAYLAGNKLKQIGHSMIDGAYRRADAAKEEIRAIEYKRDKPARIERERQQREADLESARLMEERKAREAQEQKEREERETCRKAQIGQAAKAALDGEIEACRAGERKLAERDRIVFPHPAEQGTNLQIILTEVTPYTLAGSSDPCRVRIFATICTAPAALSKGQPLEGFAPIERDIALPERGFCNLGVPLLGGGLPPAPLP